MTDPSPQQNAPRTRGNPGDGVLAGLVGTVNGRHRRVGAAS